MNRTGKTVFLNVHPDVLFRRLRIAKQQRPILQGRQDDELMDFIIQALENVHLFIGRHNIFLMRTNWKIAGRLRHLYNACKNC